MTFRSTDFPLNKKIGETRWRELSVLTLQHFCEYKVIPNWKLILECLKSNNNIKASQKKKKNECLKDAKGK